jgi:Glycosyltransferase
MELRTLLAVLSETRARLLHIYFGHIAVHLLPLIRAWKHPSIVSFHGADVMVDMNKPAYREATLQMLDAVTLVLVRSESLRRAVVDLGCDPEKIEIQRTGIPLEEFPFRDRAVPKNGEWQFVQAGRLIEKKGLPVTLRAFSTFLKQHPNATLTIAGEGPLLPELQKFARESGVADRVSFTVSFRRSNCVRSIIARTSFCTRARLAATEIKKAFQFDARSNGHGPAGVCHRARRHSRSNREWRERRACARAR